MTISPQALLATIKINLLRRPLVPMMVAESILDCRRTTLYRLLESGVLPWAWNVSATGAKTGQAEIRILSASIVEHQLGRLPAIGATADLGLPEVVDLVLPATRASVRAVELQRIFHCSPDLIQDLHLAGELVRVKEIIPARGVNSSPRITRASVVAFLKRRRLN